MSMSDIENRYLVDLSSLTMAQKIVFAKGRIQTVSDLLLQAPSELAKRCKMTPRAIEGLVDLVCKELCQKPRVLSEVAHLGEEKFTTGDATFDNILSGGIHTGMLWEISGENNAGKTQLALQLSLSAQLPHDRGGVSGATCYVSTRGDLRTERLQQIIDNHPILSSEFCGFSDIFTLKAMNFAAFVRTLTEIIPRFAEERVNSSPFKPVKVVVIDTFSDLFDPSKDPEYDNFINRARDLKTASLLLHRLATTYRLAVVILCSTRACYPRTDPEDLSLTLGELLYSDQQRWFSRAHCLAGEDAHEGVLGRIWPNQVNARIMMNRTARTRPRHKIKSRSEADRERASKRRRIESGWGAQSSSQSQPAEEVPLRRLSLIFSTDGPSASCDYVILEEGVIGFPLEEPPPSTFLWETPTTTTPRTTTPESSRKRGAISSKSTQSLRSVELVSDPPTEAPGVARSFPNVPEGQDEGKADVETQPPAGTHAASDSDYYYWQGDDDDAPYTDL